MIRRIICMIAAIAAALVMTGCRSRVTNLQDNANIVPDDEGVIQQEYEMRRDELDLHETKESLFSRFFTGDAYDDEEYYDDEFDDRMDEYHDSEDEEDEYNDDNEEDKDGDKREGEARVPTGPGGKMPAAVTVTLDANGGTIAGQATAQIKTAVGYGYGDIPAAEYEGYTFQGWFTEAEGGEKITDETKVTNKEAHTLYAHWKKTAVASSKISFDAGEGSISSGDSSKTVRQGDAYGSFPSVSRTGYDLLGWFTSPDGGDQVSEEDIFDGEDDITLYAHWDYNAYKYWSAQLDMVSVSSDDRVYCYIETDDNKTTSKSPLLDSSSANNIAGGRDKEVTDEWIIGKNPDYIVKISDNEDKAIKDIENRLPDFDGGIIVLPDEAIKGSDQQQLYYAIYLCSRIYSGVFNDSEVVQAASELGI